jgi:hypothetical protein
LHRRQEEKDAPPLEAAPSNGSGAEPRTADGVREVRRLFHSAPNPPRWPMYIRQAKQFLRNVDASFDERKYGFASLVDLMRACQRDGLFRIERDRQGVMRLFPGTVMQAAGAEDDNRGNVADEPPSVEASTPEWTAPELSAEAEVVDADVVQGLSEPAAVLDVEGTPHAVEVHAPAARSTRGSRGRGRGRAKPQDSGNAQAGQPETGEARPAERRSARKDGAAPKTRKAAAKPRVPRPRARKETPAL